MPEHSHTRTLRQEILLARHKIYAVGRPRHSNISNSRTSACSSNARTFPPSTPINGAAPTIEWHSWRRRTHTRRSNCISGQPCPGRRARRQNARHQSCHFHATRHSAHETSRSQQTRQQAGRDTRQLVGDTYDAASAAAHAYCGTETKPTFTPTTTWPSWRARAPSPMKLSCPAKAPSTLPSFRSAAVDSRPPPRPGLSSTTRISYHRSRRRRTGLDDGRPRGRQTGTTR